MDEKLFWSPQKLLSHDRLLSCVIGARGVGKSFGIKMKLIDDFLKHKRQFIYLRMYKTELQNKDKFFDDVRFKYEGVKFEVKGNELRINGELAGWAIPLSRWQSLKSVSYPNVYTIFFDEFIREKDMVGYPPDVVGSLLNLMDTVFRNRNTSQQRVICASNSVTVVNPYFLYFNFFPRPDQQFTKNESIVVEVVQNKAFADERRKTRFGKLIAGTPYEEMAIENKFTADSDTFVEKRSKKSQFNFGVRYEGKVYGIWVDREQMLMYMSESYDPKSKEIFALTSDDLTEKNHLITAWRNNYKLTKMVRAFTKGMMRFENQVVRNKGYEIFRNMRIY
jgi:Podovirus DNA encapsidation protein (Gp16).